MDASRPPRRNIFACCKSIRAIRTPKPGWWRCAARAWTRSPPRAAPGDEGRAPARRAEAQQEYFKAYAGDPENADFAYNLAVSLDHLRQRRLARDYYVRAAALADKRGAGFDPASARLRADQLAN